MTRLEVKFVHPALCLIRYPRQFEVEAFRSCFEQIELLNPPGNRFGVITDLRITSPWLVDSQARAEAAEIMKTQANRFKDVVVCEARITESSIVRGMVTVYDWLTPDAWPRRTFRSAGVAQDWVQSSLGKTGIELPAGNLVDTAAVAKAKMPLTRDAGPKATARSVS